MKKLFTLIAFLAVVMGAKAEWVEDYKIDYSSYSGFPFYVMGYVPEWYDGVMTDFGANYKYVTIDNEDGETSDVVVKTNGGAEYYRIALSEPGWHQYFIADGISTELDGAYTVKAMVKASEACDINVNMGWGWGDGQSMGKTVHIGTSWEEVEWEYTGIGGTSCNLVAQPGTVTATIEWKYLTVSHNQKDQRPVEWLEQLENGNAETAWADPNTLFNDNENNYKICAWGKENGVNVNENGGSDPFPCRIEDDGTGNHVFVVHATDCTDPSADASAWDNQFWIESPKPWKSGTQIKISFDYKASQEAKTNTQMHHQEPSNYQIWYAIGDVTFTTEWQHFEKTITIDDSQANAWSVAFNLNPDVKTATDFYFDNLSWQIMKLDEGLFAAGCNTKTGLEYDLDNAAELVWDEDLEGYATTLGTVGKEDTWVNQVMVSTVRGNDAAFKGATLKPTAIVDDEWVDYAEAGLAKLNLPAAGVWVVAVDPDLMQMYFHMLEGDDPAEPIEINPNTTEITVHGQERDWRGNDSDGNPIEEGGVGEGQPWDNQFFIVANRELEAGEVTVVEFDYVGSVEAKTTTQCHGEPGAYIHWSCIGDVTFTTEEQHFSYTLTIPSECAGKGMKSIAFNMAEIKGACDYTLKNFVWKLEDNTESLIDTEGGKNFFVKEGAGTAPYCPAGINEVVNNKVANNAIYNVAGQRVSENYKGIVIKNGVKLLNK